MNKNLSFVILSFIMPLMVSATEAINLDYEDPDYSVASPYVTITCLNENEFRVSVKAPRLGDVHRMLYSAFIEEPKRANIEKSHVAYRFVGDVLTATAYSGHYAGNKYVPTSVDSRLYFNTKTLKASFIGLDSSIFKEALRVTDLTCETTLPYSY